MKKRGFTLAEILVSIGVVGVVAAAVIPSLVVSKNQELLGNGLSNAITAFESGISSLMLREGVTDVFSTNAWKGITHPELDEDGEPVLDDNNNAIINLNLVENTKQEIIDRFVGNMAQTFPIKHMGKSSTFYNNIDVKSINSSVIDIDDNDYLKNAHVFVAKNNVAYLITINNCKRDPDAKDEMERLEMGTHLYSRAATVVIDVNGKDSPNIIGRDLFFFVLGSDGVLYPFGSDDVRGIEFNSNWRGEALPEPVVPGRRPRPVAANLQCIDDIYTGDGMGCTARLIENKFEYDY